MSLSNSDLSDDSDYRRKICKKRSHSKKDPIKLCAKLTAKLLTTAYKLNIIKLKLDEYPLHRWIYFLTFVDSLEVILYQYKETCEVLLDYPKIGGENIQNFVKKIIRNIFHSNIDVHSRMFIAELPVDGVKCIEKLHSHCAIMTFADKIRYDRIFNKSHIKEGSLK